ncbi:MAG: tetratricopeptide repeat protein, partial [Proteobacteria bacterium]|nr:tetratricopeptide repeat protein [Pseudomonadota bacterium]
NRSSAEANPARGFYRCVILAVILVPLFFLPYHPNPEFEIAKTWLLQILALFGIGFWLQSGPVYSSRTYIFLFLFFALCSLSVLSAPNPYLALSRLGFLAGALAFFLLGIHLSSDQVQSLLKWAIFSGVLVSLLGILQTWGILLKPRSDIYRELMYPSTFRHANFAAQFLAPLLPITAGVLFATRRRFNVALLLVAFLIQAFYLVATHSRAGCLSAFLGIVFLLFFWLYFQFRGAGRKLHSSLLRPALLIGSLLVLLGLSFYSSPPIRNGLSRLSSLTDLKDPANRVRLLLYQDTLKMVKAHPLSGIGLGNYPVVLPDYWSGELRDLITYGASRTAENAHNDYLTTAAESGLPALLALAALIVFSLFITLAGLRKKPDPYRLSALGGLLVLFFHAAFDYPLQNAASALIFWILLGIIAGKPASKKLSLPPRLSFLSSRPLLVKLLIFGPVILLSLLATRSLAANYFWQRGFSEYVRSPLSAEKSLQRAEIISPHDHQILFLLGNIATLKRNTPEAVRYYRAVLKLFPTHSKAQMNLAELYLEQGRFPEAESAIEKVLQLDPRNPGANYRRAVFLALKG